jgi:hypothetical protein
MKGADLCRFDRLKAANLAEIEVLFSADAIPWSWLPMPHFRKCPTPMTQLHLAVDLSIAKLSPLRKSIAILWRDLI